MPRVKHIRADIDNTLDPVGASLGILEITQHPLAFWGSADVNHCTNVTWSITRTAPQWNRVRTKMPASLKYIWDAARRRHEIPYLDLMGRMLHSHMAAATLGIDHGYNMAHRPCSSILLGTSLDSSLPSLNPVQPFIVELEAHAGRPLHLHERAPAQPKSSLSDSLVDFPPFRVDDLRADPSLSFASTSAVWHVRRTGTGVDVCFDKQAHSPQILRAPSGLCRSLSHPRTSQVNEILLQRDGPLRAATTARAPIAAPRPTT